MANESRPAPDRSRDANSHGHNGPNSSEQKSAIVVVGASARAAAQSIRRANFVPWSIDFFADLDLLATSPVVRIDQFRGQLPLALRPLPPAPWMYTGGLENHPRLLAQLARERTLYGTPAAAVRTVRDPWSLEDAVRDLDWNLPEMRRSPPPPVEHRKWLWKPWRGAGGVRVSWVGANIHAASHDGYYQRYIDGELLGAAFVAAQGKARLIGVTRQLAGPGWGLAPGFAYGGSVGPWPLTSVQRQQLDQLGDRLAGRYSLVGLFGVDLVDDGGRLWLLEVNPRYTASMEILERALHLPLIAWHVAACRDGVLPPADEPSNQLAAAGMLLPQPRQRCYGKAVVYARHDGRTSDRFYRAIERWVSADPESWIADIPSPASPFYQNSPITTAMASSSSAAEVQSLLVERVKSIEDSVSKS